MSNAHIYSYNHSIQIEDHLLIDYIMNELTVPLRDVANYEAHNGNDSSTYQRLVWVQTQLNTSLEEIQNIASK